MKSKVVDEYSELPGPVDLASSGLQDPKSCETAAAAVLAELRKAAGDRDNRPSDEPLPIPCRGRTPRLAGAVLLAAMGVAGVRSEPRDRDAPSPRAADPSGEMERAVAVFGANGALAVGRAAISACNLQPAQMRELRQCRVSDGTFEIRESDHALLYVFAKYLLGEVRTAEYQRRDRRARIEAAEKSLRDREERVRQLANQLVDEAAGLTADMHQLGRGFDASSIRQQWVTPLAKYLGRPDRDLFARG